MKKRLVLGIAVLSLILSCGLWMTGHMNRTHMHLSHTLRQARDAALAGNWEDARTLARQAELRWQGQHRLTAAFADQTPMDEIDGLFAELQVFSAEEEMPHFSAVCAHLSRLTASMAESHHISWWNFL